MGMLTRKQQWRRTRTRKQSWGDLPPEVLEAMLAAGSAGMSKSVSWDHSFAAGMKMRAERAKEEEARRATQREVDATKAAAAAATSAAGIDASKSATGGNGAVGGGEAVYIPRSVSCSSLAAKRSLFQRSASRDEFGSSGAGGVGSRRGSAQRRRVMHRRGVSFDTQVWQICTRGGPANLSPRKTVKASV